VWYLAIPQSMHELGCSVDEAIADVKGSIWVDQISPHGGKTISVISGPLRKNGTRCAAS
jgi:hypothetical protein